MLNKLIQMKNSILIVCVAVLFILWTLTLIFGDGEDKMMALILFLILPFVIYGFLRLAFKLVRINAPLNFIRFCIYFFFIFGVISVVFDIVYFITRFPNGLSPTLTASLGMIFAVLDEAKKNIDIEGKK